MAYEINVHVDKSGKLEADQFPLELSVYRESKRVKLLFQVDQEIDSTYHYLKFTHKNATYLYRVHNNEFEIPKAITAYVNVNGRVRLLGENLPVWRASLRQRI